MILLYFFVCKIIILVFRYKKGLKTVKLRCTWFCNPVLFSQSISSWADSDN